MNFDRYQVSLEKAKTLLSSCKLLISSDNISKEIIPTFYKTESIEELANVYRQERERFNFNFLLYDGAYFQFLYRNEGDRKFKLRYCFIQFPYHFPDYKQFLIDKCKTSFPEVGYSLEYLYFQALDEASLKEDIAFFRYDYSEEDYKEGVHGVSHIHVGFSNLVRLSLDKILTPEAFVFFVIKQVYYPHWNKKIDDVIFQQKLKSFKNGCPSLDSHYFKTLDKSDLFVT